MSGEDDALREMAANRGCKLVKSRRRKPGGDFGHYGLKDAKTGKEVLGFGSRGLTATAEEVASYLRSGAVAGWKRSLIAPVDDKGAPVRRKAVERRTGPARKKPKPPERKEKRPKLEEPRRPEAKKRAKPEPPKPKQRAEPEPSKPPKIREAKGGDAEAVAKLLEQRGYEMTAADIRKRLKAFRKAGEPALVADRHGVVGCVSWHVTPVVHRPRPVGRITMLVVAEAERGAGLGTALLEAAEARLRERGCGLIEVTSNMKRMRAHAFYEARGFERISYRFAKTLAE